MAKVYDFRIVLRRAEFSDGFVSVPYGQPADVFLESFPTCTLAEALALRAKLSGEETRPHVAQLSMRYRDARAAPGVKSHFQIAAPR